MARPLHLEVHGIAAKGGEMIVIPRGKREDAGATAIRECRQLFLLAAAKHPQIKLWKSLVDEVFEPERNWWAARGLPVPQKPVARWTTAQVAMLQDYLSHRRRLMEKWARARNLDCEWVYQSAGDHALGFESFPAAPFNTIPGYAPPEFDWPDWVYAYESKPAYRNRIRATFLRELDAYIKTVETQRRRLLKDRGSRSVHYRWAAERVCLAWTWSEIADQNNVSISSEAVRKAVHPILDRIGIPDDNLTVAKKRRAKLS